MTERMSIYLVRQLRPLGLDGEVKAFVVAAPGWAAARVLAVSTAGSEGGETWVDYSKSETELLGSAPNGEIERIIVRATAGQIGATAAEQIIARSPELSDPS